MNKTIILTLVILLTSCSSTSHLSSKSLSETETLEVVSTSSPLPTMTVQPEPALTFSSTPRPTNTRSPLPTLSKEQADKFVNELLSNNGDCLLPCWFGISPGITTWESARNILEPFSSIKESTGGSDYIIGFSIPNEEERAGLYLIEQDGVVSFMRIGPIAARRGGFIVSNLLTTYGKPDQIYLSTTEHVPYPELPFFLGIYYREKNIFAGFRLVGQKQENRICSSLKDQGPYLWLWSDKSKFELPGDEFPEWALGQDEKAPLMLSENETQYDIQSFYETFQDSKHSGELCTGTDSWEQ